MGGELFEIVGGPHDGRGVRMKVHRTLIAFEASENSPVFVEPFHRTDLHQYALVDGKYRYKGTTGFQRADRQAP
jgi:hypothetical protein